MENSNGNGGSPTPFPKDSVPIIGQAFTMKEWFVTLSVVCNCESKEPVLLVGNGVSKCRGYGRMFQSQGMKGQPDGSVQFLISLVVAQKPPATV